MPIRLGLLLLPLALLGCSKPPPSNASGQRLFDHYCAECHGDTAAGRTFFGYPSLVDEKLQREMVRDIIKKGSAERGNAHRHREEMPAFGMLSDAQIERINDHLVQLRKQRSRAASPKP
ncbi:MAG: cytochrome c [Gammaproteobacteria bacterium SHHR-1]